MAKEHNVQLSRNTHILDCTVPSNDKVTTPFFLTAFFSSELLALSRRTRAKQRACKHGTVLFNFIQIEYHTLNSLKTFFFLCITRGMQETNYFQVIFRHADLVRNQLKV